MTRGAGQGKIVVVNKGAPISDLASNARVAVEAAIDSAWHFFMRSAEKGLYWDDVEGCRTRDEYLSKLAGRPGSLYDTCKALLEYDSGLRNEERWHLRTLLELADAVDIAVECSAGLETAKMSFPATLPLTSSSAWTEREPPDTGITRQQYAGAFNGKLLVLTLLVLVFGLSAGLILGASFGRSHHTTAATTAVSAEQNGFPAAMHSPVATEEGALATASQVRRDPPSNQDGNAEIRLKAVAARGQVVVMKMEASVRSGAPATRALEVPSTPAEPQAATNSSAMHGDISAAQTASDSPNVKGD